MRTVILTLSGDAGYTIGSPSNNTVAVAEDDLPTISITANNPNAAEQGYAPGRYTVTRAGTYQSGDMTDLVVYYAMSGTASNVSGTDYNLSGTWGSVTITGTNTTATITLTPVNDSTTESTETAVMTLSTNANYTVGSPVERYREHRQQ